MVDRFIRYYSSASNMSRALQRLHIDSLQRFTVRNLANIILPLYFRLAPKKSIVSGNADSQVMVSITSFPARINNIWMVIETLARQSIKADAVILWLSKEQFHNMEQLPKRLRALEKKGLRIELRKEDLRSHKKYYYAMQEFPNHTIITIDDDIFYHSQMIESLLKYHAQYPRCVIANHTSDITYDSAGEPQPYIEWQHSRDNSTNYSRVQIGVGGVLYPPGLLYKDVLNKELSLTLAKLADDLWLYTMTRLSGSRVIQSDHLPSFLPILNRSNITLTSVNNDQNMNDIQIEKIREHYIKELNFDPFARA